METFHLPPDRVHTVQLQQEEFTWAIQCRGPERQSHDFGSKAVYMFKARVARLPEQRYLRLHATWQDGARAALYFWLRRRRLLSRLADWAEKRWPVRWTKHDAMLLFPAISLPEHLRYGMAHQIAFLDQQLPIFTGRKG